MIFCTRINGVTISRRQEKMITPFSYDSILFSFNLDTIETFFGELIVFIAVGFFSKENISIKKLQNSIN